MNAPATLRVPSGPERDLARNKTINELRHPQFASELFPQAAFIITTMPVDDPLLSRISVDPSGLPIENHGSWRLRGDVQHSWKRLEKGLWLISDLLFDGLPSALSKAVRDKESWDRPEDFGYMEGYRSEYAARRAARHAHKALLFLAARCSLAVACYEAAYGVQPAGVPPPWLSFLTEYNIPPCWLDALHRSIITRFLPGTRAGVAVDLCRCPWPHLIPVIVQARVPLFLLWESEAAVKDALSTYTFAATLVPHRSDWQEVRMRGPPMCTHDGTFHLYRHGRIRIHPDNVNDPSRPPHGPFQRPAERLEDFLIRQKRKENELRSGATPEQTRRRAERESHANSGLPPGPRTRVYVWMRLGDALPETPLLWHNKPYRMPVAASAVRGLWAVQPADQRRYNSFFDEWDMWLPPSRWLDRHDPQDGSLVQVDLSSQNYDDATTTTDTPPNSYADNSVSISPSVVVNVPAAHTSQEDIDNLDEDLRNLYPSTADWSQRVFIRFRANFVAEWYGFKSPYPPTAEPAKPSVIKYLHGILGVLEQDQPIERGARTALAACVTAVLAHDNDSEILKKCWDLNTSLSHNPLFNRRRVQSCTEVVNNGATKFLVRFPKDAATLSWTLALSGPALVSLLRRSHILDTHSAVRELVLCGVAFNTVSPHHQTQRVANECLTDDMLDCRQDGYPAGLQDYGAYMTHVVDILQRPHARAGLMKGGIIWRLMVEAVGQEDDMRERFLDRVHAGPSANARLETTLDDGSARYIDDDLSETELDVISGTYLVFTGAFNNEMYNCGRLTYPASPHRTRRPKGATVMVAATRAVEVFRNVHRHMDTTQ